VTLAVAEVAPSAPPTPLLLDALAVVVGADEHAAPRAVASEAVRAREGRVRVVTPRG
jgi:hypothetical protein